MVNIRRKGFTLAEVLIVLGIIGMIAELTIPTLINSTSKIQYTTGLEKFYANFSNGMRMYMSNQSCPDMACTGLFDGNQTDAAFLDRMQSELPKIFNVGKLYGIANSELASYKTIRLGNTTSDAVFGSSTYSFSTADNFFIGIYDKDGGNCVRFPTYESKAKNSCALVYIDVNGVKKPNQWGRDSFIFALGNDGVLYPRGGVEYSMAAYGDNSYYWVNGQSDGCGLPGSNTIPSTMSGMACASRIMDEGWKMDY